jgi:hypothetical protein
MVAVGDTALLGFRKHHPCVAVSSPRTFSRASFALYAVVIGTPSALDAFPQKPPFPLPFQPPGRRVIVSTRERLHCRAQGESRNRWKARTADTRCGVRILAIAIGALGCAPMYGFCARDSTSGARRAILIRTLRSGTATRSASRFRARQRSPRRRSRRADRGSRALEFPLMVVEGVGHDELERAAGHIPGPPSLVNPATWGLPCTGTHISRPLET